MPRIWLSYLTLFVHPSCPAALSQTHARRTFDRALRTLPPSLHERIWHLYLTWASPSSPAAPAPETVVSVWRRYLSRDPSPTFFYIHSVLLSLDEPRPLEAAKRLLDLARKIQRGEYKHPTGSAGEVKSAYQVLVDWLEVCEKYAEEVGLDAEDSQKLRAEREKAEAAAEQAKEKQGANGDGDAHAQPDKRAVIVEPPQLPASVLDPTSSERLDVDGLIRTHGLAIYPDQAGRLWTGLATFWIKKGEFGLARETFEEALSSVVTLRDFTQVFDAYAEFEESAISALMETIADAGDDEGDAEDKAEDEKELDERMKNFEELMDRRPFLVNEVLLRRNPNDVQEWEKRVALYGTDDEKVCTISSRVSDALHCARGARSSLRSMCTGGGDIHPRDQDDPATQGHRALPPPVDPLCQVLRAGRRDGRCREGPRQRAQGVREGDQGHVPEGRGAGGGLDRVGRDGGAQRVSPAFSPDVNRGGRSRRLAPFVRMVPGYR